MMEVEMVSETLGFSPQLTRLDVQEDFIEYCYGLPTIHNFGSKTASIISAKNY
jgi:hypothetical protein